MDGFLWSATKLGLKSNNVNHGQQTGRDDADQVILLPACACDPVQIRHLCTVCPDIRCRSCDYAYLAQSRWLRMRICRVCCPRRIGSPSHTLSVPQPEGARRTMIGEAASGVKQLPPHEIIGLNFPTCSSTRAESFSGAVQLLARKLANPSIHIVDHIYPNIAGKASETHKGVWVTIPAAECNNGGAVTAGVMARPGDPIIPESVSEITYPACPRQAKSSCW
ncbi:predicted protein [Histoplasma capsulatum var. duboisii H88]|uniref:Predicted protein n=1 Tax=Ajellomyces capsulatus (strain H88) TaxID=544711 RepID=F0UNX9_AJEC8|nr:predicted protein [Histoplasma capsulatum var. duboisii H88]